MSKIDCEQLCKAVASTGFAGFALNTGPQLSPYDHLGADALSMCVVRGFNSARFALRSSMTRSVVSDGLGPFARTGGVIRRAAS